MFWLNMNIVILILVVWELFVIISFLEVMCVRDYFSVFVKSMVVGWLENLMLFFSLWIGGEKCLICLMECCFLMEFILRLSLCWGWG